MQAAVRGTCYTAAYSHGHGLSGSVCCRVERLCAGAASEAAVVIVGGPLVLDNHPNSDTISWTCTRFGLCIDTQRLRASVTADVALIHSQSDSSVYRSGPISIQM